MSRPRVAHCIRNYLFPTETFVGNQIRSLRSYEPIVVCYRRRAVDGYDVENTLVLERPERTLRAFAGRGAYAALRTLLPSQWDEASAWVRRQGALLWHFHYGVDAAFFLPLKRRLQIPAIVSFYGYDVSSFPNAMGGTGRLYLRRVFREMDAFLAMSEDMKRDLIALGAPEEKTIVHYYGSDCERFRFDRRSYQQKEKINILCVGTLEVKKGQHHLVETLGAVKAQCNDIRFRLTLVGEGPLRKDLTAAVQRSGVAGDVDIAGFVPHHGPALERCYQEADLFVLYSTTQPDGDKEGIPGTIVEAMASGLPVISTMHAGIPEVIQDGRDGILVREGDLRGLQEAIVLLCRDQERRKSLGQAGARRALQDLHLRSKTRKLEEIYDRISGHRIPA